MAEFADEIWEEVENGEVDDEDDYDNNFYKCDDDDREGEFPHVFTEADYEEEKESFIQNGSTGVQEGDGLLGGEKQDSGISSREVHNLNLRFPLVRKMLYCFWTLRKERERQKAPEDQKKRKSQLFHSSSLNQALRSEGVAFDDDEKRTTGKRKLNYGYVVNSQTRGIIARGRVKTILKHVYERWLKTGLHAKVEIINARKLHEYQTPGYNGAILGKKFFMYTEEMLETRCKLNWAGNTESNPWLFSQTFVDNDSEADYFTKSASSRDPIYMASVKRLRQLTSADLNMIEELHPTPTVKKGRFVTEPHGRNSSKEKYEVVFTTEDLFWMDPKEPEVSRFLYTLSRRRFTRRINNHASKKRKRSMKGTTIADFYRGRQKTDYGWISCKASRLSYDINKLQVILKTCVEYYSHTALGICVNLVTDNGHVITYRSRSFGNERDAFLYKITMSGQGKHEVYTENTIAQKTECTVDIIQSRSSQTTNRRIERIAKESCDELSFLNKLCNSRGLSNQLFTKDNQNTSLWEF